MLLFISSIIIGGQTGDQLWSASCFVSRRKWHRTNLGTSGGPIGAMFAFVSFATITSHTSLTFLYSQIRQLN